MAADHQTEGHSTCIIYGNTYLTLLVMMIITLILDLIFP